jgi:hypothetical protein
VSVRVGAAVAVAAALLAYPAIAAAFAPGAAGVGDPYFPSAGNGGLDVSSYALRLRFRPGSDRLSAGANLTAVATQDLSRFNLDYDGPRVRRVSVNGDRAAYSRRGKELVITPAAGIAAGASFVVEVAYRGRPGQITDPDGSREGWFRTRDGAFVVGEPRGTRRPSRCGSPSRVH